MKGYWAVVLAPLSGPAAAKAKPAAKGNGSASGGEGGEASQQQAGEAAQQQAQQHAEHEAAPAAAA